MMGGHKRCPVPSKVFNKCLDGLRRLKPVVKKVGQEGELFLVYLPILEFPLGLVSGEQGSTDVGWA